MASSEAHPHPHHPEDRGPVEITHPNRDKPVVQATRATVIALLIASAALVAIVTIGGWSELQGMTPVSILYVIVYATFAFFAVRWNRGILPVAAALAVLLMIFAAVAAPAWFDRDKFGFSQPALNSGVLGLLTLLIVPLQIALIFFAMRGFGQGWNVEVERRPGTPEARPETAPTPA